MKLLMITRKVDKSDALSGFTYNWVKKLSENLEKLYVISWQKGDSSGLGANVKVIHLTGSKWKKIFTIKKAAWKILGKVDGVFCHMNPEYTILVGPCARLRGKKIVSWYTHKAITIRRRLMELLAHRIVTASKDSFRRPLKDKKVEVLGHGIDTDKFKPKNFKFQIQDSKFKILTVGRISPTKDYESIIKAVDKLKNQNIKLKIVGDVILKSQQSYLNSLKKMVKVMGLEDRVEFTGWVANHDMPSYYQSSDLFINMSGTGSLDKVVLEAMACGTMVLTSNEAFEEILPKELMVAKNNPDHLAVQIKKIMEWSDSEKEQLSKKLRQEVKTNHNLDRLAQKIVNEF